MIPNSWIRWLVCLLFFCTGGIGLIYQITWTRDLNLIFGASHQAVSIVLAAFMGGLALGGLVFGRTVDRVSRPLRLYAYLEFSVAICALLLPWILAVGETCYVRWIKSGGEETAGVTFLRVLFAFVFLLLPTAFMGGTLPALTRWLVSSSHLYMKNLSLLYGLNTLGAVGGTLLCGFVLLPRFGVLYTERLAALINILAAILAFFADRLGVEKSTSPTKSDEISVAASVVSPIKPDAIGMSRLLFYGTFICGFSALAFEVLWSRGLAISLGPTIYTLTIMLAAFLSGIALGGIFYALIPAHWAQPKLHFLSIIYLILLLLLGISGILVSQSIPHIPQLSVEWSKNLYGRFSGFRPLISLIISYLIMLVPAFLFGLAFPLSAQARSLRQTGWGKSTGDCLSLNTLGAIFGALAAGFILIPGLGLQKSMLWISVLLLGYGILIFCRILSRRIQHPEIAWAACLAGWLGVGVIPYRMERWDTHLLGSFRNNAVEAFIGENGKVDVKGGLAFSSLVYYREGRTATISVTQSDKQRSFLVNGKSEATDSMRDLGLQKLMGHIPCLLHPHPKTALVLGLGAGISLGAVTIQPGMEQVQLVEIEPAVLAAAETFNTINNQALHSPNLKISIQDGRNFLRTTNQTYDIITADPVHPWAAGSSYLFTADYYEVACARLNPGGLMCQWLPMYELSRENLKSVLATFHSVFPYVLVWQTNLDLILIGSRQSIVLDLPRIRAQFQDPRLTQDFHTVNITDELSLLALFVTDAAGMKPFLANAVINTDDNLYLEFSSPYSIGGDTTPDNLDMISTWRSTPIDLIRDASASGLSPEFLTRWQTYQRIEMELLRTELRTISPFLSSRPKCYTDTIAVLEKLWARLPEYFRTQRLLSLYELTCGTAAMEQNDSTKAEAYLHRALELDSENARAHCELSRILTAQNRREEAILHAEQAIAFAPLYTDAWINRGVLYELQNDLVQAERCYKQALETRPDYYTAYYNLGVLSNKAAKPEQAARYFILAINANPQLDQAWFGLSLIRLQQGHLEYAKKVLDQAMHRNPNYAGFYCGLGIYWQMQGANENAVRYLSEALRRDANLAMAHLNLAAIYQAEGKFAPALEHVQKAQALGYPVPPDFLNEIQKKGNRKAAINLAPNVQK